MSSDYTQILCHQRSWAKDSSPGLYDSTFGGHVLAGEDPHDNAVSELHQELGITAAPADVRHITTFADGVDEWVYRYMYILADTDISRLVYERDEVLQVFWRPVSEIKEIYTLRSDPAWVYRVRELEIVGEIEKSRVEIVKMLN